MTNKMTQRDFYNEIIALAKDNDRNDIVEFAEGRIAVLDKKSANKKPTKTQEENEVLKDTIVEVLAQFENGATVSEVLVADDAFKGLSNQKVSALLKQLVDEKRVVKSTDKKKSIFSVVAD